MGQAAQSISTQSQPTTLRLRGLASFGDYLRRMPPDWPHDLGRHVYGPGALPRPVPAMMTGGVWEPRAPRWTEAWEWLRIQGWTHAQQIERMLKIAQICSEYGPRPRDADAAKELDDLMDQCLIPFVDATARDLWVTDTEAGLLMVFATASDMVRLQQAGSAALCGWPGTLLTTIGPAHQVPADQVHPWGIAFETMGWLYWA